MKLPFFNILVLLLLFPLEPLFIAGRLLVLQHGKFLPKIKGCNGQKIGALHAFFQFCHGIVDEIYQVLQGIERPSDLAGSTFLEGITHAELQDLKTLYYELGEFLAHVGTIRNAKSAAWNDVLITCGLTSTPSLYKIITGKTLVIEMSSSFFKVDTSAAFHADIERYKAQSRSHPNDFTLPTSLPLLFIGQASTLKQIIDIPSLLSRPYAGLAPADLLRMPLGERLETVELRMILPMFAEDPSRFPRLTGEVPPIKFRKKAGSPLPGDKIPMARIRKAEVEVEPPKDRLPQNPKIHQGGTKGNIKVPDLHKRPSKGILKITEAEQQPPPLRPPTPQRNPLQPVPPVPPIPPWALHPLYARPQKSRPGTPRPGTPPPPEKRSPPLQGSRQGAVPECVARRRQDPGCLWL